MKIQRKKRTILITSLLVLVLAGGVFAYLYFANKPSNDSVSSNSTPTNTLESDHEQARNLKDNPDDKDKAPNTDHPAAPTAPAGSSKKQVQMVASTDQSNGTVYIRGGINYPVTGGSCYAQLSGPSGQSIRKDSTVLANPASTDCKTISIPVSDLASGKWTFTLHYTSDDYEGVSDEISFAI